MADPTVDATTENSLGPAAQEVDEFPVKIYVGNLPYDLTDEGLQDLFKAIPQERIQAKVTLRDNASAGFGFIGLASEDDVQEALEVNRTTVGGREIKVQRALTDDDKEKLKSQRRPRRFYPRHKNFSKDISEAAPNGATATQADNDAPSGLDATFPKPRRNRNTQWRKKRQGARGPKTVTEGAIATVADGDHGEVDPTSAEDAPKRGSSDRRQIAPRVPAEPSETELYIQNLPFKLDQAEFQEEHLRAIFIDASYEVLNAKVVLKYRPRRLLGFVDVGSYELQQKALKEMHGKTVGGRVIVVKVAYKTTETVPETIDVAGPAIAEPVAPEVTAVDVT